MNWLEENYIDLVSTGATAATTDVDSDRVDMQTVSGNEITFIVVLGDVDDTSALELQVHEHTADAAAGTEITADNATFTAGATDADDKILAVTVKRSKITKRYVYATLVRGTANAVVDAIIAIVSGPRTLPFTQSADVIASATVTS